jgi:hypothetical protein
MTEWSSGLPSFFPAWDCNGCAGGPDGMFLAADVVQAFSQGQVNAYVYWWAAGDAPATLIHTTAEATSVAKRFYALAMVSRYVLPGAVRVAAESPDPEVRAAAFRNPDGGKVLVLVNGARTPRVLRFRVDAESAQATVRTVLTDSVQTMTMGSAARLENGVLTVPMPRRAMMTVLFSPASVPGAAKLEAGVTLARLGDGSYQAQVKVVNAGPGSATDVQLDAGMLGTVAADQLPKGLGDVGVNGWRSTTLHFGAAAGRPGRRVTAEISGHCGVQTFRSRVPVVLP